MAVTSIWPVHGAIKQVIDYAGNPSKTAYPAYSDVNMQGVFDVMEYASNGDKTDRKHLVSGINCIPESATEQMVMTKQRYGKTGGTVAFHAYQSFRYKEASPELAHQIGVETAQKLWGDRFEVVVSTHLNTDSIHNHFVINSVSFADGKRLNDNKASHRKFREVSDQICRDYKLSVVENPSPTSTPRSIYFAEKQGFETRYNIMRRDIDETIKRSFVPRFFYNELRRMGYLIRYDDNRKYATIQIPGTAHPTRFKTLGEEYTEESIEKRIDANLHPNRELNNPPPIEWYDFSVFSLRGLYEYHYYVLEMIHDNNHHPYYNAALRADVKKMESYSQQAVLLCRNKIDTVEQLQSFMDKTQSEIKKLCHERDMIYTQISRCTDEKDLPKLLRKRDKFTIIISSLRRDLKNSKAIMERSTSIAEKLMAAQTQEQHQQMKQQSHQWER